MDELVQYIDWQEIIALVFFTVCWCGYAHYSDHINAEEDNLLAITNRYRAQWMRQMVGRENRTMDAIMVGNLQRSITFFANTTIFILLGLMTMLGYHDRATAIIGTIPFARELAGFHWQIRVFLLIVIFIYAFFKYTWSLRQYNYAGIFINSIPPHNECSAEDTEAFTAKGSALVSNAARHFNNGLRAYYFGLAALAWFIDSYAFMLATAWVVWVTYRREYRSTTLKNLIK